MTSWQCTVLQYIDDWLFITASQRRTTEVTHLFIHFCVRLSLTANLDKSSLMASQSLVNLGVQWDFCCATVRPLTSKMDDVTRRCAQIQNTALSSQSAFEALLGKLVFLERLVRYGQFHYRHLQRFILKSLRLHR